MQIANNDKAKSNLGDGKSAKFKFFLKVIGKNIKT